MTPIDYTHPLIDPRRGVSGNESFINNSGDPKSKWCDFDEPPSSGDLNQQRPAKGLSGLSGDRVNDLQAGGSQVRLIIQFVIVAVVIKFSEIV